MKAKIVGLGFYAPPRVVHASEIAGSVGWCAQRIIESSRVVNRHWADEPWEALAVKAARDAIGRGPPPDLIINASTTPRQCIPDGSVFLQRELGYSGIAGHTVHASCLSFLVALHTAAQFVSTGLYRRILIVSAEVASVSLNFAEPESAILFGDGAAAAVIERSPPDEASQILAYEFRTWPEGADLTELRGGGTRCHPNSPLTLHQDNLFHMDGPAVFKIARKRLIQITSQLHKKTGIQPEEIDLVVPHQASGPALDVLTRLGYPKDRIVEILSDYGNCIAASIPMALAIADREGRLKRGDSVLLIGSGAGLAIAGLILRW